MPSSRPPTERSSTSGGDYATTRTMIDDGAKRSFDERPRTTE
jgi:hypothetical protein